MPRKTMYIVYRHTNKINHKCYIGITTTTMEKRSGKNGRNYVRCSLFWRAIQKYGWENFEHEILTIVDTAAEAYRLEKFFIALFRSNDAKYGYNLSTGGESGNAGHIASEETRKKQSEAHSGANGYWYGKSGNQIPWYGTTYSREHRSNISASLKGKPFTKEHRDNLGRAMVASGKWVGETNPMFGKTYGNAPQARCVRCIETGVTFDSCKSAAEWANVAPTSITKVCKGRGLTTGGYHWEYVIGGGASAAQNETK